MECSIDQHLEQDTFSDINSINEDDSYIEIELNASSTTCYYNNDDDDDEGEISKEYQLRISISSTISVSLDEDHVQKESLTSLIHNKNNAPKVDAIEAPCDDDTTIMTCAETGEVEVIPLPHYSSAISKEIDEQVEFSMEKRLCNNDTVSFNRKLGLESAQSYGDGQTTTTLRATRVSPYDKVDALYASSTRKQPNLSTTASKNGGMMKLLIKFRGIKMGALLASLIKPRQHCHANNNGYKSSSSSSNKKSKTFFQCYQKILVNPKFGRCNNNNNVKRDQGIRRSYSKNWDLEDDDENSIYGSFRSTKKSSTNNRVMEVDLGALRGIFNAMGMNNINGHNKGSGSKSKRSTSRSTSCDTTPIHEVFSLYSSENSNIQAAIAYCKSSLGQTSEFSF